MNCHSQLELCLCIRYRQTDERLYKGSHSVFCTRCTIWIYYITSKARNELDHNKCVRLELELLNTWNPNNDNPCLPTISTFKCISVSLYFFLVWHYEFNFVSKFNYSIKFKTPFSKFCTRWRNIIEAKLGLSCNWNDWMHGLLIRIITDRLPFLV